MEKSDGNHRAAEIIREIVGLVDRAEHRVDRLYGYVSAGGGQRNVIVLNESARSGEQARCTDPPLQRTRNCSFSELAAQPGAQYCEQACPYRIERTGRAAQGVGHLPEGGLQDEQVLLGSGKRLFTDGTIPAGLRLVDSKTSTTGVIIATYEPAGEVSQGSFALEQPAAAERERRPRL